MPVRLREWLTLERGTYLGLALLALALRLANLGAQPLSDAEAEQALVAWRVLQGQAVDHTGYSPLLATLNMLGFLLLGANEFAVRLGPALLGVALVLLPFGMRRHLGQKGALAAAAFFAISPGAVHLSRTLNGEIGVAVGGLAFVVGLFSWLDSLPPSHSSNLQPPSAVPGNLYLAAAGLVLMLIAAPAAYSMLVLLLGLLALAAVVGGKNYVVSVGQGLAERGKLWGSLGLTLIIGILVLATAFLLNMGGLTAAADLLSTWLLGFAPTTAAAGIYPAIFLISLYEPLVLLAGLFGMSAALLRRRLVDLFLAWWFFGGVALNLLRPGRTSGDLLLPLVPLTLLAGLAVGMLWDSLRQEGSWQKEGIIASTGLIISAYAYISLMTYTRSGGLTFWLPVAGLGLFVALVALFWLWYDGASSLRGAALAGLIVLVLFAIASGSRLNNRGLADPRQPLVNAPAAEGLPALVTTLSQLSSRQVGDPFLLRLIADRHVGPAVEWQLRRFPNVTWVDRVDSWPPIAVAEQPDLFPQEDDLAVILSSPDVPLSSEDAFAGQDFSVRAFWSPAGLRGQSLIRWIVLRTAPTPISFERAVLWVEQPQPAITGEAENTSGEAID
jgi:hypothetical protein